MDLLVNIYLNNIKIFSVFLVGVGRTTFFLYSQI